MRTLLIQSSPPAEALVLGLNRSASSELQETAEGGGPVHVAVGKSVEKTATLLSWTFRTFPGQEICLLHVHRPSPLIPTLLGKLPASQANPEIVLAFRNEERKETKKLLSTYIATCNRSKVKASIITTEADAVQEEIVNLVNQHKIQRLVIEATPYFMKGKKSSCKSCFTTRYAPPYCKIWFVNKGKLIWTREASGNASVPDNTFDTVCSQTFESRSLNYAQNEGLASQADATSSTALQIIERMSHPLYEDNVTSSVSNSSASCCHAAFAENRDSSISSSSTLEECLSVQFAEIKMEVDETEEEVHVKRQEQKQLEAEARKALNKVKALEMAYSHQVQLRMDAEDDLRITMQEQEKLLEEAEKVDQQLQMSMRSIALLDNRAREADCRREEAAEELKLVRASISTLRKEKWELQKQKNEAKRWLKRWRSHGLHEDPNDNRLAGVLGLGGNVESPEFLLSDLESATCDFSESFRIGQGGYGIVYKGEMLNRTVAIKKLHSYNMQRQTEFHNAVEVLMKLHHPRLVEMIGVCSESWLLVYEYLSGGSLQNYLSNSNSIATLNWKTRARVVADIASGLLFLHSSMPKIVHGNLKPENCLLDYQHRCKISDYGDHMLTSKQTLRCPSFRHYSGFSRTFIYTDPESYRTGSLTYKSDIYSFGIIILQLVTGKTQGGLVAEVSKVLSNGKVASILDLSAGEWPTYVGRRLLELGLQCCELNSRDRPELTPSLVKELGCMPYLEEQPAPSFFLCPILREIMHDPQVAADGFTYEGEALRGWLEDGHETSPMTNLRLSHLNLTPNLSLRLAIQDWLANLKVPS